MNLLLNKTIKILELCDCLDRQESNYVGEIISYCNYYKNKQVERKLDTPTVS